VQLVANPTPIGRNEIVTTIGRVMSHVDALAITQEQILRAAFFAHLPPEVGQAIGTAEAAVHPERPTPSRDYVVNGKRGVGMRARYDLGFGHPSESVGIAGVAELKAGVWTLDRLETLGEWDEEREAKLETAGGEIEKLKPLHLDLWKLLDPKLPQAAFRISWIASGKRGHSTDSDIRDRAIRIVERVAKKRKLSGTTFRVDQATGWLICKWPPLEVTLELAWYRPTVDNPERFEPVFAAEAH
jgi:hypothetical protein